MIPLCTWSVPDLQLFHVFRLRICIISLFFSVFVPKRTDMQHILITIKCVKVAMQLSLALYLVLNTSHVTVCVYWDDGGEVTQSGGVTITRRGEY